MRHPYSYAHVKLGLVCLGLGVVVFLGAQPGRRYQEGGTAFAQQQLFLLPECGNTMNASNIAEVQGCFHTGACPWQSVLGGLDSIRVLSAHLDSRFEQSFVRVIAAASRRQAEQEDVWCLFPSLEHPYQLSKRSPWQRVKANATLMRDDFGNTYTGVFFDCPLDLGISKVAFVSVSIGPLKPVLPSGLDVMCLTGNMLPVNHGQFPGRQVEFGACIKVMHSIIPSAKEIVEFVEFSRLLGVEHFTFYNDTTNKLSQTLAHVNSSCALRCYKDQGLLDVMDFGLDLKDIQVKGSIISTNDCVYKRRHQYKYHVQVDTDEFIVPRVGQPSQYRDFLPAIRAAHNISEEAAGDIREYGFQMSYFPDECRAGDRKYRHDTTIREVSIYGYGHRSKYISVTQNVIEAGPHNVVRGIGKTIVASSDMALVHHYRPLGGRRCSELIEDRTAERYQQELETNMASFLDSCDSRCGRLF